MQSTLKPSLLAATIFLLHLSANAQQLMISAGASVGKNFDNRTDASRTAGALIGAEISIKKFSLGVDLDWQTLESLPALAEPIGMAVYGDPILGYTIQRRQYGARVVGRYYLTEAFKGAYVGVFATMATQFRTTSDYPTGDHYLQAYATPPDYGMVGGGFTYGYRFKIAPKWRLSLSGSHQWGRDDAPEYKQKNHQFIAGLGYTL